MRALPLLLLAILSGCASPVPAALLAADLATVAVFGRGLADIGISAVTGRDCSLVRLDRGQTYCVPNDPLPPEQYCTRSLGVVDCWANPALLPSYQAGLGDTPPPNPAQERYRAARWPKSLWAN